MAIKRLTSPFVLPVASFAMAILCGAVLLSLPFCAAGEPVAFIDALFIATSSVCVTGLASVDPSTVFNHNGHVVMLAMIQLGGLGIMTYSTLIFYLLSKKVSLTSRLVGEALLMDSSFHLGRFLQRIATIIIVIELAGAALLHFFHSDAISPFHALFIAISAFCNAGFALWPDNLLRWQNDWAVNCVVMSLIILGGIGFFVLDELLHRMRAFLPRRWLREQHETSATGGLSYHSRLVIKTSFVLVLGGAVVIFAAEWLNSIWTDESVKAYVFPSFFQSVSARTAGFSSIDLRKCSDISLLVLVILMFIGGSPGSCAGGIKTTTFRVLLGFIRSSLFGRQQVAVQGRAASEGTVHQAMTLVAFSILIIAVATVGLIITENHAASYLQAKVQLFDLFFEVVSAFATVGLSLNLTPQLSVAGKCIICVVMFVGRIGPIWLLTMIQQFQREPKYSLPEKEIVIG